MKLFLLVALLLVPTGAWGHGGVAMDLDPCIERAGVYLVHFSAYQPQEYATEEFCRSVPQTGSAILVFDLIDPELRKKSAAVRIVEEINAAEPRLLLDIPARVYPSGVVNAEVNFDTPGQYTALMTVDGVDGAVRFPIRVASLSNTMLVLIAGLLIGCGVGYYVVGGKLGWPPFPVKKVSSLLKG
ncbi:MAG: hypothetical protein OXC18_12985 [Desulfurellaceae bacterium]|nr:hypothetical protein [Desulfurellaceae bacterium]